MPYVVCKQNPIIQQMSFEDILSNKIDISKILISNKGNTRTFYRKTLNPEFLEHYDFQSMTLKLSVFVSKYKTLFDAERQSLYSKFPIAKKTGGVRIISAPCDALKIALTELKNIFENDFGALYHTSAYAYIKNRSTVDCARKHQSNESKWFAKLDFSDFFGSTTEEFVFRVFSDIFPFSEIVKTTLGKELLQQSLNLCFLDGGLPQGTPISPIITNIMMIPIDHYLSNHFRKMDNQFVYTRYADDIFVSSRYDFDVKLVQSFIEDTIRLFNAPLYINHKKTRYGSSAGRNWMLGVMLNKDNKITLGHKNHKTFKAVLANYIGDCKNGRRWAANEVQVLQGNISYYRMVEGEYIDYIIEHYNEKFNVNIFELIKADLKGDEKLPLKENFTFK
jgi:hypothetical protein